MVSEKWYIDLIINILTAPVRSVCLNARMVHWNHLLAYMHWQKPQISFSWKYIFKYVFNFKYVFVWFKEMLTELWIQCSNEGPSMDLERSQLSDKQTAKILIDPTPSTPVRSCIVMSYPKTMYFCLTHTHFCLTLHFGMTHRKVLLPVATLSCAE